MKACRVSKRVMLPLILACFSYSLCCTSEPRGDVHVKAQDAPGGGVEVVARISERDQLPWSVSSFEVGGRENLESIYLLDEKLGWVGGEGALYQTSTAGRSWERVRIDMPPGARVADIFFTNSLGWAILQTPAPDTSSNEQNQARLLYTGDGGVDWRAQYVGSGTLFTRTAFKGQEGWLVGLKYIGPLRVDTALLVLHTLDQGGHWTDVSEQLNRVAVNEKGFVIGWIKDVIAEGPLAATVLTSTGQVFRAEDGGRDWSRTADQRGTFSRMNACCFGYKEGRLRWIAASQSGEEGVGSLLTFEQPHGQWKRYYLGGVYLRDVLYLSDSGLFIAGSMLTENRSDDLNQTEGVVMYSSDAGLNWSVVYRDAHIKSINALASVNPEHILAVSDGGKY